jgi:hypothetical protein
MLASFTPGYPITLSTFVAVHRFGLSRLFEIQIVAQNALLTMRHGVIAVSGVLAKAIEKNRYGATTVVITFGLRAT